jgi:D-lactate dehydrogenase
MNQLVQLLSEIFPAERIKASVVDRYAYAGDAGFYYLLPKAVVLPQSADEIVRLFAFAHRHQIPVTFRTGGTSLSGQSISDGILADLSRHWKQIKVWDDGARVTVGPSEIGAHVNHYLKKYGRKIGPDPASITAAMMGGILSNNSSGMCCGVQYNAYHTLQHIAFILPNGHAYDTAQAQHYNLFEQQEKAICGAIIHAQEFLTQHPELAEKIRTKYKIKNTVGYSLNALLDYVHPLDVFAHLLIGAEGTLAFITQATLHTIPDKPFKKTGMLFFENPVVAAERIAALKATGAEALELMDRPALKSVEHLYFCPPVVKTLPAAATGILCEYQAQSLAALETLYTAAQRTLSQLSAIAQTDFTNDATEQAYLWKLRKGMYPSVAAVRASGTTAMLEDVAVPLEHLGAAVTDLQALFAKYNYHDAIIFGHAKEGNLHFLVTQGVNTAEEIAVFEVFNDELAELIIHRYNGSLKAEHGTGRQIAPYVKEEWGADAYVLMENIKKAADPAGILNPGVILNSDDKCHLKNLKTLPVVEEEVDKCVECGYCENRCPSRDYTLTPRQRIQVRRALQRLKKEGNQHDFKQLQQQFQFSGMDTCAVDGMCATDCPVAINTGELIKRLRRENHSENANKKALWVAKNFATVERMVKLAMYSGHAINKLTGGRGMNAITRGIKKMIPAFPLWTKYLTAPVSVGTASDIAPTTVVYFATCITRMMGADKEAAITLPEVIATLCKRAGIGLVVQGSATGQCCGQLFSSKGFADAYRHTVNQTVAALWQQTQQGKFPVLIDVTSCTYSLQQAGPYLDAENKAHFEKLTFIDSIDFAADYLLPTLQITQKKNNIVFHPVCTVTKMNLLQKLQQVGHACAHKAVVPSFSGCCGMAGDRGFYYPALTAAATRAEAAEVIQQTYDGYYSSGKTCEMALSEAIGANYQSLLYLLYDASKPA